MANQPLDTTLLDRAIIFAVRAHAGTERRGKGFPYIVHPMEAMEIVSTMTADQELLAAAALHDTVEDTDVTLERLREEFGERVADLVAAESDAFVEGVSEEDSWHDRKQAAIDNMNALKEAHPECDTKWFKSQWETNPKFKSMLEHGYTPLEAYDLLGMKPEKKEEPPKPPQKTPSATPGGSKTSDKPISQMTADEYEEYCKKKYGGF